MGVCYKCGASAAGACTRCGQSYCSAHGNKTAGNGILTRAYHGLCDACHAQVAPKQSIAVWVGILAIAAVLLVWYVRNHYGW
jgi:hypothetical protein